jgi:hypothetical protein
MENTVITLVADVTTDELIAAAKFIEQKRKEARQDELYVEFCAIVNEMVAAGMSFSILGGRYIHSCNQAKFRKYGRSVRVETMKD